MNFRKILMVALVLMTTVGCGEKTEPQERSVFHLLSFDGIRGNRYLMHLQGPQEGATLYTQTEVHQMQHVPAASGAKYADERLMVWVKGEEVLFEVDGQRVGPCQISGLQPILAKAWLSGGDFWAVGNEPAWNLVIGAERCILITDLGQTVQEFPGLKTGLLDPRAPEGRFDFESEGKKLTVEILPGRCTNTMSGEPFAVSVRIVLDEKEMTGCGTGLY